MSDSIRLDVFDRIAGLQPARTLDVGGYTYIDKNDRVTLFTPPMPLVLPVSTLTGFVDLLNAGFEGFDPAGCLIHVAAHDEVDLLWKSSDGWGRRRVFISAKAPKPERVFEFDTFITQEAFNIKLRSMFVQDAELDALVQLAGNIAKDTEIRQVDDGFSQQVTAKAGMHLVREQTVKSRVTLRPYRTFLEVEQPAGDFIFRVKHDEMKGNLCALFVADAGDWKLTAIKTIKAWLENKLKGSNQGAVLGDIPIIA